MLVLPPLCAVLTVQVLAAALAVALTSVLVAIATSTRRKMRAVKQLAHVPGPKGVLLLGLIPELMKNFYRIYDYQVCDHVRSEAMP